MPDRFASLADAPDQPARRAFVVTPSDSTDFVSTGDVPKFLVVGGAGTLVVQMVDDTATVSVPVAANQQLDIRVRRVLATGTTATNIVAFA